MFNFFKKNEKSKPPLKIVKIKTFMNDDNYQFMVLVSDEEDFLIFQKKSDYKIRLLIDGKPLDNYIDRKDETTYDMIQSRIMSYEAICYLKANYKFQGNGSNYSDIIFNL